MRLLLLYVLNPSCLVLCPQGRDGQPHDLIAARPLCTLSDPLTFPACRDAVDEHGYLMQHIISVHLGTVACAEGQQVRAAAAPAAGAAQPGAGLLRHDAQGSRALQASLCIRSFEPLRAPLPDPAALPCREGSASTTATGSSVRSGGLPAGLPPAPQVRVRHECRGACRSTCGGQLCVGAFLWLDRRGAHRRQGNGCRSLLSALATPVHRPSMCNALAAHPPVHPPTHPQWWVS